ncbi:MAG: hypothetical protein UFJ18_13135 [Blautia sp.]|nr:hypothetical protein [Blautia sp.]
MISVLYSINRHINQLFTNWLKKANLYDPDNELNKECSKEEFVKGLLVTAIFIIMMLFISWIE